MAFSKDHKSAVLATWPRVQCGHACNAATRAIWPFEDHKSAVLEPFEIWARNADSGVDLCVDMFVDMCVDMCVGMCVDMCVDICLDLCSDMVH